MAAPDDPRQRTGPPNIPGTIHCAGCDWVVKDWSSRDGGHYCMGCMSHMLNKATSERDQARNAIKRFGNTDEPSEFDWNVLGRIDELETALEKIRGIQCQENHGGDTVDDLNGMYMLSDDVIDAVDEALKE